MLFIGLRLSTLINKGAFVHWNTSPLSCFSSPPDNQPFLFKREERWRSAHSNGVLKHYEKVVRVTYELQLTLKLLCSCKGLTGLQLGSDLNKIKTSLNFATAFLLRYTSSPKSFIESTLNPLKTVWKLNGVSDYNELITVQLRYNLPNARL